MLDCVPFIACPSSPVHTYMHINQLHKCMLTRHSFISVNVKVQPVLMYIDCTCSSLTICLFHIRMYMYILQNLLCLQSSHSFCSLFESFQMHILQEDWQAPKIEQLTCCQLEDVECIGWDPDLPLYCVLVSIA